MAASSLDRKALMRAWARTQGFTSAAPTDPTTILTERSWVRTLGGADPYFALFARGAEVEREAIDAALRAGEMRISPAVRGCMYLVAAEHADLALGLAYHQTHARLARDLDKAGAAKKDLTKTRKAVLKALAKAPSTTAELRKVAAKAIVSFGASGKKVGLSSSLPPTLRLLEFEGEIERTPIEGRLDTETYRWSLRERPLERPDSEDAALAIAELFFRHHGPATLDHFVTWSGLGKRAARAALAELELVEIEGEDHDQAHPMLAFPAALEAASKRSRAKPVTLLGLQDTYLVVHGGPSWVCPAAHLDLAIPRWGTMGGGAIRATKHPHLRAILVAGELAGFWDVDAAMSEQHIAWLDRPSKAVVKRATEAVDTLRRFMADELGHAKTFSIDSNKRIDARFEIVRGLA